MSFTAEESRIEAAYARRRRGVCELPDNLIDCTLTEQAIIDTLKAHGVITLKGLKILDIGCGSGVWPRKFIMWGAQPKNVAGIELLPQFASSAKNLCPVACDIREGSAGELPWPDESFDIVFQSLVFSSILDASLRAQVACEMLRVLKPGGVIVSYDMRVRNPWNPDVMGIGKAELKKLFPDCRIQWTIVTPAPPFFRRVARLTSIGYELLAKFPVCCSHYVAAITIKI